MIDLHYWPTSNGRKITIMLHEVELPYNDAIAARPAVRGAMPCGSICRRSAHRR